LIQRVQAAHFEAWQYEKRRLWAHAERSYEKVLRLLPVESRRKDPPVHELVDYLRERAAYAKRMSQ
jgi:hypothetical protein